MEEPLPERWWQDKTTLERVVASHGSQAEAARATGCGQSTLSKWWRLHGLPRLPAGTRPKHDGPGAPAGVDQQDDRLSVTTPLGVNPTLGDVDALIRGRGLNPDEWEIEHVKVNEWEGFMRGQDGLPQKITLEQLTAHLRRLRTWDFIVQASADVAGRVFPAPAVTMRVDGPPWLEWVGGDQQAGYHDPLLHQAVCLWLRDVQPDGMSLTGDTVDLPTISRHADRPHWNLTPQECLDAGYVLLYDYCDAAPAAVKKKLRGNHDWRLESEILTRAERLWGLRPGKLETEDDDVPLYSIRRLLRLDELGIDLYGREGDKWELGEIPLAPDLVVMHQPPPLKKFARLGRDVIAGDTHRQRIEHLTEYDAGEPVVRTLMQVGMLGAADGLGYTRDPDWQQGFGTVTSWPNGSRLFELARWDGQALTWRGETWKP